MARRDNLQKGQFGFLHGSPNEIPEGGQINLTKAEHSGLNRRPRSYASSDPASAAAWGRLASEPGQRRKAKLYQVEPVEGSYKRDYLGQAGDISSTQPMRVVRKLHPVYTPPAPEGHPNRSVDRVGRTMNVANWAAHNDVFPPNPRKHYSDRVKYGPR